MDSLEQLKLIQKRVVNAAIGPSTLRNQGAPVTGTAKEFLSNLDLNELKNIDSSDEFGVFLNNKTTKLKNKFSDGAKNFGTARKAINVFIEEAFYNKFLSTYYGLDSLVSYLEIPLDSGVATGLKKDAADRGIKLSNGVTIKNLTEEINKEYQKFASELAKEKNIARIYLDLVYWPPKK